MKEFMKPKHKQQMDYKNSTVILGAGLAGLSAAYHGGDVIFEKETHVGGMCHSIRIDGFTFDYGIHVLHTKDKSVLKLLKNKLRIKLPEQERKALIYSHDTYTRYPIQANTYGLPIDIVKRCLVDFVKAYNYQKTKYPNYEEWILGNFGEGIGREFLIPYSEKFWTVLAKEMTTDWLDVRIPKPSLDDVIEGALTDQKKGFGPNAKFMYPAGGEGIGALGEKFKMGVRKENVATFFGKTVTEIDVINKKLIFKDGACASYCTLISTIPLPELVKMVRPTPPMKIINAAKELKFNSIICVNLGIDDDNINPNHWIYYPEKKYCFFRLSFVKNFSKDLAPKSMSSILAEISYSCAKGKTISKSGILKKTIIDLIVAKIISIPSQIVTANVKDIKYGYVIYDHRRKENVNLIKNYLSKVNIITAGRYGSWEYQWMDDAILDGKKAIEKAKKI